MIPQLSAIMGPTAGGAVYSPAMTDWIFMVKNTSFMFITGPQVILAVLGEEVTQEDLGGAMAHNEKSGNAHFACENDQDCIDQMKKMLSYLPPNNMEDPPIVDMGDDPKRIAPELNDIIPDSPNQSYDMKQVIAAIVDNGEFFEPHQYYAPNILVGFARLNGRSIGIIANQPKVLAGCLDIDASDKASRFIRFCDAFNVPMLTIADVPGYLPGTNQEWGGIIRHGAKLLWVYSEATVPKLLLVTRKDYGGSYLAMCARDLATTLRLPGRRPRSPLWVQPVPPILSIERKLRLRKTRRKNARSASRNTMACLPIPTALLKEVLLMRSSSPRRQGPD